MIGDPGMSSLSEALERKAISKCRMLKLSFNQIGDAGMIALSNALSKGAAASLKQLYIEYNPYGDAAEQQLKAACNSRGITGSSFLSPVDGDIVDHTAVVRL